MSVNRKILNLYSPITGSRLCSFLFAYITHLYATFVKVRFIDSFVIVLSYCFLQLFSLSKISSLASIRSLKFQSFVLLVRLSCLFACLSIRIIQI